MTSPSGDDRPPCRRCGHPEDVHRHLRNSRNCSLCRCPRYQRWAWPWQRPPQVS